MISEVDETKKKRAKLLGFDVINGRSDVVAEVQKRTAGDMADVIIDAAGVPQTAEMLIDLAARKGRIVVVAIHKTPASVLFRDLSYKELAIFGTRIYENNDFAIALDLIANKKVDLQPIITHIFPISKAVEAFKTAETDSEACKVLLYPDK